MISSPAPTDAEVSELVPLGTPETGTVDQMIVEAGFNDIQPGDTQAVEKALRQLPETATGLDSLGIATLRETVLKRLTALEMQSPARLFDAAFAGLNTANTAELQGTEVLFAEPEPWPDPVNTAVLLDDLVAHFTRYIVLPRHGADTLSLYAALTWVFDAFDVLPTLASTSPEKRCGKSNTLDAMAGVACRPLSTSNISPAALYRVIEKRSPVLLIDEVDTFLFANDELRGILNAGHRRGTAFVIRCVGEDDEPRTFSTWAPKVIAMIGELPDTQQDRAIEIRMRRKEPGEKVQRFNLERVNKESEPLRRKLARFAKDSLSQLKRADPVLPDELHDRAQDNWRGLAAIAELAGGHWPAKARVAAVALSGGADHAGGSSFRTQLLHDLKGLFDTRMTESLSSEEVCTALKEMEDRPWPEWKNGKPMTPRQLAKALKPFSIEPRQRWRGSQNVRGYALEDCRDAFGRYLEDTQPIPSQKSARTLDPAIDAGSNGILSARTDPLEPRSDPLGSVVLPFQEPHKEIDTQESVLVEIQHKLTQYKAKRGLRAVEEGVI